MREKYGAFHAAVNMLYEGETLQLAADEDAPSVDPSVFDAVADLIFKAGGFDINQVKDPAARKLMRETANAINRGVDAHLPTDVPDTLRYALEENGFIFSGFKTFHAMREIGLSLLNDKGEIKQYADFQADVLKLNDKYNKNYLYAEYKHAIGTCQMAAKWHKLEADGDRYLLQYRTAQDERVREDHALMDGITLPPSDPFWDKYYPPNGWGCRCTAVQVRRGKYAESDPAKAMMLGDNSTAAAKQQIFRFNAGKTMQLFPPKHPYFKAPENSRKVIEKTISNEYGKQQANELTTWYKQNLPETKVGKYKAKRFSVEMPDGQLIFVNKNFYNECISHYADDELYVPRLVYARMAHLLLPKSKLIRQEPSKDHNDATFDVYQFNGDSKYIIELKVKCNADGMFLHYMRLYKK